MVFTGNTSGPAYTTTLLPSDTFINVTKIAQALLRVKLVRPQIRQSFGIFHELRKETEDQAIQTKTIYDQVWRNIVDSIRANPLDTGNRFNANQQHESDKQKK
jgi:hypothetical protein